nr:Calx-beta domain-containing protein [Pleionea sp. CnH1-48]
MPEGNTELTFTVQLSTTQTADTHFSYGVIDSTATKDIDYEATAGNLTIPAGSLSGFIKVNLLDDNEYECDEYFLLQLNGNTGNHSAFGIITYDGDAGPELTFSSPTTKVKENEGNAHIALALSSASCTDTKVSIDYPGGSATDSDFTKVNEVTIPAGELTATIALPIIDDNDKEDRESTTLSISSNDQVSIFNNTHELVIYPVNKKLFSGYYGTCALTEDNLVKCWGYGNDYNFATGEQENIGDNYAEAEAEVIACHNGSQQSLTKIFRYSAGNGSTCDSHGGIGYQYGIDLNNDQELSDSEVTQSQDRCSTATRTFLIAEAEAVNESYVCPDGGYRILYGTDDNNDGELKTNEMGQAVIASNIGDAKVIDMGLGEYHTCALFDTQEIKCWGRNKDGVLGLGQDYTGEFEYIGDTPSELGNALEAVNFGADKYPTQLSVGNEHNCALLNTGEIKCWGNNESGILGYGDIEPRGHSATTIGDNLASVDLGTDAFGQVYTAQKVSAGHDHTCALLNDGNIKCWGANNTNTLGRGDNVGGNIGDDDNEMGNNLALINLGTNRTATDIFTGDRITCAILDDASFKCWGRNLSGQIGLAIKDRYVGNGGIERTWTDCHTATVNKVTKIEAFNPGGASCSENGGVNISIGNDNNPANGILDDGESNTTFRVCHGDTLNVISQVINHSPGSEQCSEFGGISVEYGYDHGNNGTFDNEMGDNLPAIELGTSAQVVDVNFGWDHTCIILSDETYKCWGSGEYGESGMDIIENWGDNKNETPAAAISPDMGSNRRVIDFGGRGYHTCGLLDNFEIKCWGYSEYGTLGIPFFEDKSIGNGEDEDGNPALEMGDNLPTIKLY